MFEIYVLVPVKRHMMVPFIGMLSFALAIGTFVLACMFSILILLAFAFAALGYWLTFQTNKEFEYSYFDGEVRFAKVINKSRRRSLAVYSMDEVAQIAPSEDRSVMKYQGDHTAKVKDYTSHRKDVPYYVMVVNHGSQTELIRFEPDDKYLDAVMIKYAQKVIRRR